MALKLSHPTHLLMLYALGLCLAVYSVVCLAAVHQRAVMSPLLFIRNIARLLAIAAFAPLTAALEATHGVAAGDVTADSAVIWSRADQDAQLVVTYGPATGTVQMKEAKARARAVDDFTAQVLLTQLMPDTAYRYEARFVRRGRKSSALAGLFRTAPMPTDKRSVALIWSGDLAGQRYCRRPDIGYRIFDPMRRLRADFFVANGDMIYADGDCPAAGMESGWENIPANFPGIGNPSVDWEDPVAVYEVFNAHWRYNREDRFFQAFLASTPIYVQWDDHEVINDFGARSGTYPPQPDRAGFANVVAAGRKSMFDYHPIVRNAVEPGRIYRQFRWGAHVELFIVDARSYRSDNADKDSEGKTMLGEIQLAWLKAGLAASDATWKIVSSDVPLSVPTGSRASEFGRDAFAGGTSETGFEHELLDLVEHMDTANIDNVVFVATDVHSAAQLRYERDYNGDGDQLLFHELIAGPLSAIRGPAPVTLDATLGPVMVYGEGGIFNFGAIQVDAANGARLSTDIRDEFGLVRPGSERVLEPD